MHRIVLPGYVYTVHAFINGSVTNGSISLRNSVLWFLIILENMYNVCTMFNICSMQLNLTKYSWCLTGPLNCNQILPPWRREAQSKPVKPPKHRCPTLCNCVKTKVTWQIVRENAFYAAGRRASPLLLVWDLLMWHFYICVSSFSIFKPQTPTIINREACLVPKSQKGSKSKTVSWG